MPPSSATSGDFTGKTSFDSFNSSSSILFLPSTFLTTLFTLFISYGFDPNTIPASIKFTYCSCDRCLIPCDYGHCGQSNLNQVPVSPYFEPPEPRLYISNNALTHTYFVEFLEAHLFNSLDFKNHVIEHVRESNRCVIVNLL